MIDNMGRTCCQALNNKFRLGNGAGKIYDVTRLKVATSISQNRIIGNKVVPMKDKRLHSIKISQKTKQKIS